MTVDDLLQYAPKTLDELTRELLRRTHEAMLVDATSQSTACLQLALRSASILSGMARVLDLATLDSFETLNRAAIEARDLLMYFRFDEKGIRERVGYWFAGGADNAWKADHTKIDEFLTKQGAVGIQLASNWSKLSVLTHPTKYAADNSSVIIVHRMTGLLNGLSIAQKRADYVVGISRLIMAVTYDLPGWIPLGVNEANMPSVQSFSQDTEAIAAPILDAPVYNPLPSHSIRLPKKKPYRSRYQGIQAKEPYATIRIFARLLEEPARFRFANGPVAVRKASDRKAIPWNCEPCDRCCAEDFC